MPPANSDDAGGNLWLKSWSDENTKNGSNLNAGRYLGFYLVFGVGAAALTVVQTLVLWIFCSIEVRLTMAMQANQASCSQVVRIGIEKVAREDGNGDLQVAHVLFRRHTGRPHSQ